MAAPTFVLDTETVFNTNTTPKTTGTITATSGDTLVAAAIQEGQSAHTISTSGGTPAWTEQEEINLAGRCNITAATATAAGDLTVTFTRNSGGLDHFGGIVVQFRASDGIGAAEKGDGSSSGPRLSITTTQANSAIVVFQADFGAADGATRTWATVNGTAPSAGNGYELAYYRDAARYTLAVAYYPDAGAIGAKSVGVDFGAVPAVQTYSLVAIEVKGTAAGGGSTAPIVPCGDVAGIIGVWDQLGILGG